MKFQTIISVAKLVENLDTPNCLILDCRGGVLYEKKKYERFLKSHIPKAFYYCFTTESLKNADTNSSCSCTKATTKSQIIESLQAYGFDKTSQIIIYDDESSSSFTDSMWLFLRSIGYKYVAVLQGGFVSWEEQGMPLSKNSDPVTQKPNNNFDHTTSLGLH